MEWLLHHYAASPYAEKARLMLGHKRLAWGSIDVPMVPPRPVLQQLLGGFRRIPVLQHGADLFCDTRLLPDVLDSVHPERPLMPAHARALSTLIAQWAEPRVFLAMGPVRFESRDDLQALQRAGIHPGDFLRDRAPFMAPAVDTQRSGAVRDSARDHVLSYLGVLQGLLGEHAFLCGDEPCAADFSAYHTVWWLRAQPRREALLSHFAALGAWADRMAPHRAWRRATSHRRRCLAGRARRAGGRRMDATMAHGRRHTLASRGERGARRLRPRSRHRRAQRRVGSPRDRDARSCPVWAPCACTSRRSTTRSCRSTPHDHHHHWGTHAP